MNNDFGNGTRISLSSVEELVDEARNGRMFLLVDDEDRENEGDLVIPAQMATPEAVNFMATHGRGLICLALTQERVAQLGLPQMSPQNGTRHETAFTVSIEARDGVTTGISAADRARTITTAIDASKKADDLVTPGHVFPLAARPGGVLVRAGHTEAAVDIARLAGLNPSGVICEVMNDDGTMARLDDLLNFAERHSIKIGTIRDLIAYRRRHDHDVERVAQGDLESAYGGSWRAIAYRHKTLGAETLALVKGDPGRCDIPLVRMHQLTIMSDALGQANDRSAILATAMRMIDNHGTGVVVLINRYMARVVLSEVLALAGGTPIEEISDFRDYGIGAQVLSDLGIEDMILLTNRPTSYVAIAGYGLRIVEQRPLDSSHVRC